MNIAQFTYGPIELYALMIVSAEWKMKRMVATNWLMMQGYA